VIKDSASLIPSRKRSPVSSARETIRPPMNGSRSRCRKPNRASSLLEGNRLRLGSVLHGNGEGPEGTIYDQKPQAGSWVGIGSKIDISIVQGAKPPGAGEILWVFVPDLTGQTQKAAEEILRKENLTVGSVASGVASTPAGTVFSQLPLARLCCTHRVTQCQSRARLCRRIPVFRLVIFRMRIPPARGFKPSDQVSSRSTVAVSRLPA
jgi:PASTA domain